MGVCDSFSKNYNYYNNKDLNKDISQKNNINNVNINNENTIKYENNNLYNKNINNKKENDMVKSVNKFLENNNPINTGKITSNNYFDQDTVDQLKKSGFFDNNIEDQLRKSGFIQQKSKEQLK